MTKPGATPSTQWLTAGHCGYTGSSNWYNYGMQNYSCCSDGRIGSEKATAYDPNSSYIRDVMRVGVQQPPGTNVMSGGVIGEPNPSEMTDPDPPVQNMVLCMSWGWRPEIAVKVRTA